MARDPVAHREGRGATAQAAELFRHEGLETVGGAVATVEEVFDRLTGQVVGGELLERGKFGDDPVQTDLGAVPDFEFALRADPDALPNGVLSRDPGDMAAIRQFGGDIEKRLLGDSGGFELQQDVGRLICAKEERGFDDRVLEPESWAQAVPRAIAGGEGGK